MHYINNADRGQHIQKMTSSSEEEEETQKSNNNKWQTVRSTKRKKVYNQPKNDHKRYRNQQPIRPTN
jgi:ABC-type Fe3+-hydroxamate transport system substrate-binding protein